MNQRLQLHNTAYFLAEIPNFCKSCCVHVHWFSGFILTFNKINYLFGELFVWLIQMYNLT